jgi:hypothetical protein
VRGVDLCTRACSRRIFFFFPARIRANFYLIVFKENNLDEFVGKERKSLFLSGVKDSNRGFPTKLSTDFVDKIIAL